MAFDKGNMVQNFAYAAIFHTLLERGMCSVSEKFCIFPKRIETLDSYNVQDLYTQT